MRIFVQFRINNEPEACAVTGVEGDVTDFILPNVGDTVSHRDDAGVPCLGKVTARQFTYAIPDGINVSGDVTVTLSLDRIALN